MDGHANLNKPEPISQEDSRDTQSLLYLLALTMIKGVGPVLARQLIAYCGSAEAVFHAPKRQLQKVPGIGDSMVNKIRDGKEALHRAEKELAFIQKHAIQALAYYQPRYPRRLALHNHAPVLLFFKGNIDLNHQRMLAIVGTRHATVYGKQVCEQLVEGLKSMDVCIVSGLAYGIDIIAHKTALKHQIPTIGVLGHGMDRIYPAAHKNTAAEMIAMGGLLTEFPSGTKPDRENFPARNRIIAGISDGILIVETAEKGGAMITAEIAWHYNRDVMAVPGNIQQPYSRGCHKLIKTNKAALVETAEDIAQVMNWDVKEKPAAVQREFFTPLNEEEQKIVDILQANNTMHFDDLLIETGMSPGKLSALLLNMEFNGIVLGLPGKMYKLL